MGEPLTKDVGRWTNVDLYLEYAYEAINEPKYKENCCSLWFEKKRIRSAVEFLKRNVILCRDDDERTKYDIDKILELINEAFPKLNTGSNDKADKLAIQNESNRRSMNKNV